jgi:hypothetical protein
VILLDGHTRLAAARKAGLTEVPVVLMEFSSKEDAILYTFERQVIRRNLSGGEILTATEMMCKRLPGDERGRAVELLARRLGIGSATVSRAKKVLKEAPEEELEAIRRGEKTIGEVHKRLAKPKEPATKDELPPFTDPGLGILVSRTDYIRETVGLLAGAGEAEAARMVINHFYREDEREAFISLLPEVIGRSLSRDNK